MTTRTAPAPRLPRLTPQDAQQRPCTDLAKADLFTNDLVMSLANDARKVALDETGCFDTSDLLGLEVSRAVTAARRECLRCPVLIECLRDALTLATDAVQGGTTRTERDSIRVALNIPHPQTEEESAREVQTTGDARAAVRMLLRTGALEANPVAAVAQATGCSERTVKRIRSAIVKTKAGGAPAEVHAETALSGEVVQFIAALVANPTGIRGIADATLSAALAGVLVPEEPADTSPPDPTATSAEPARPRVRRPVQTETLDLPL